MWIGLAALALGLVKAYGAKTDNGLTLPGTDSQAAFDILAQRFPPQQNGTNPFVFAVEEGKLTDPANRAAIAATYKAIKRSPQVYSVVNPLTKDGKTVGLLSEDERIAFMPVLLKVDSGSSRTGSPRRSWMPRNRRRRRASRSPSAGRSARCSRRRTPARASSSATSRRW